MLTVVATLSLLVLLAAAARSDVRQLRIPNQLVFVGVLLAAGHALAMAGLPGLWRAFAGFLVCFLMLLPFHGLRMMGAGDVKLMGMVGAFLGPADGFQATLATMLAGGAVSAWWLWRLRRGRDGSAQDDAPPVDTRAMRVPYGVAILLGTLGWMAGKLLMQFLNTNS